MDQQNEEIMSGIIFLGSREIRIEEAAGEVIITLLREEGSDGRVSVDYSVNDGSATSGLDYLSSKSGTLYFESGETRKDVRLQILDDNQQELDETISFAIGNPIGTVLGSVRTSNITILDNDRAPEQNTFSFDNSAYTVTENLDAARIIVVRSGNIEQTASVDFTTEDNFARADLDYQSVSRTITFQPGETQKIILVKILDDSLDEFDESVKLSLTNPIGGDLGIQNSSQLTIQDNDISRYAFEREIVVSGLRQGENPNWPGPGPTAFDWAPDGTLFIANLQGVVRVFDGNKLVEQPFIDLSAQVNTGGQRGLLGIAVHPEFPAKPYIYLAFSYDPPDVDKDLANVGRVTRLVRIEARPESNYLEALPNSEVILLETPPVANFHAAGAIKFSDDGSLFFSHGDGSRVSGSPNPAQAEVLQSLDNPFGKLFRIDPLTGQGYSDNPFFDGSTDSLQSKVYSFGLRNPWRYALHPKTGEPFIGDVGWTNWEEINTGKGKNFGWPLFEGGNGKNSRTEAIANALEFQELYQNVEDITPPVYAIPHPSVTALTVGDFYTGDTYPSLYEGALFFGDFSASTGINALLFDENGAINSAVPFIDERKGGGQVGISYIALGPDSNLYFSNLLSGEIGRWVFSDETEDLNLIGSSTDDSLVGGEGDDTLSGLAGQDTLIGSDGEDSLLGGRDVDEITGGKGADVIDGGDGFDLADYQSSSGGVNVNLITGTGQRGDAQGDTLISINNLAGSNFGDTLIGDDAGNFLLGYAGNDRIMGGGGADRIEGGLGRDAANYLSSSSGVIVDLSTGIGQGGDAEGDFLTRVEILIGSTFNDRLMGDTSNNHLIGHDGNDSLSGGDGNDRIHGGRGNDSLVGGDGIDIVYFAIESDGVTVNLDTEEGKDESGTDTIVGIEQVFGTNAADNMTGDENNNLFRGYLGADRFDGGDGQDVVDYRTSSEAINVNLLQEISSGGDAEGDRLFNIENLYGSRFADDLTGDMNNNLFLGGAGADSLDGQEGRDFASYSNSDEGIAVNLETGSSSGGDAAGDRLSNIENLLGSNHADLLVGDDQDNVLIGRSGNDTISGGAGADRIRGDDGADVLMSGSGSTTFQYLLANDSLLRNYDVISNFKVGIDQIDGPNAGPVSIATTPATGLTESGLITALGDEFNPDPAFLANQSAILTFNQQKFVALNDATAGFQASHDILIEITSFIGDISSLFVI